MTARTDATRTLLDVRGPARLWHGDQAVVLRPKERAVLAALAFVRPRAADPDRIAVLVWDDDPPATARKSIHNHVARLRQAVGDLIVTAPTGYALADRVELAAWHTGTGEPFADLADSLEVAIARSRALTEADAADDAALADAVGHDLDEALGRLREATLARPLNERRWWLLAFQLARRGRRRDALLAIQDARRYLAEAGLMAGEPLVALEGMIAVDDRKLGDPVGQAGVLAAVLGTGSVGTFADVPAVTPRAAPAEPDLPDGGPPSLIRERLSVAARPARVVLLDAPGGFGKTTLANQVAAQLGHAAVRAVLDRPADAATLLDELRRGVRAAGMTDTSATAERTTTTDELFAALGGRGESTVVLVDEAHRLDAGAATELARTLRGTPPGLLVIVAGRRMPEPLLDLVGPGVVHLDRAALRFDVAETAALLDSTDEGTARWITSATDGWPAAVVLAASSLRADPQRTREALRGSGLNGLLDRLVDRLAGDLAPALQAVLPTLAAVPVVDAQLIDELWGAGAADRLAEAALGPRLLPDGWGSLPDPVREALARRGRADEATARRAAHRLAERGRLSASVQMLVDLGDLDAVADVLARRSPEALLELGIPRLAVLLDRLGDNRLASRPELLLAVAVAAETRDDTLRQACLVRAAATAPSAMYRAVQAEQAADAVRFGDTAAAARLAATVLTATDADEPLTRARALTAAAMAHTLGAESSRRLEARPLLEEAVELFHLARAPAREADALRRLGYTVEHHAGSPARAAELLGRALALRAAPDRDRALLLTYYAEVLEVAGQTEAAESALREAAEIGDRLDDDLARLYAFWSSALMAAHRLDTPGLAAHIAAAEQAAQVVAPGDGSLFEFLVTVADACAGAGDEARARALLERARPHAGEHDRTGAVTMVEARIAAIWGDPAEAERLLDSIEETPRSVPHQRWIRLIERAVARHRGGDRAGAAALAEEAFVLTAELGVPDLPYRIVPWLLARLDRVGPEADGPTRVTLFGRTAVTGAAGDATPPPGLPRTLVALVATHRSVPAADVLGVLWPEAPIGTARTRLRNLLNRVRQHTGPLIGRDADLLVLDPGTEVDVHVYERLANAAVDADADARVGLARHALAHWQGEPFADHRHELWAVAVRERLRRRHLALLDIVIAAALDARDLDDAIRHLEIALDSDPVAEERHLLLIGALADQGRRNAARAALGTALAMYRERAADPSAALQDWSRRLA